MFLECWQHVGDMPKCCPFRPKVRVGANIISDRHKIFVSGISDNGKYKKSMYKLNYVGKLEKHTPGTPISPKMIHRRPILQQLFPLSPWIEQRCPQLMAPRLTMVPCKAPVVGFGGAMACLPIWVAKKRRIKKKRETWCVNLNAR